MDKRSTHRVLGGVMALAGAAVLAGCDAGVYETDVMSPAIIV